MPKVYRNGKYEEMTPEEVEEMESLPQIEPPADPMADMQAQIDEIVLAVADMRYKGGAV